MKNKINNLTRMRLLLGLTAIAALGMAPPVRAGGGSFYATVTNETQLVDDINYANTNGGTFTINLQPNTTFDLLTVNGSDEYGGEMLPIIGGAKAVNLTILGNGDTIQRDTNAPQRRLVEVAQGSSLTLDQMTLQNGYAYDYSPVFGIPAFYGGAICNFGTLVISNCTLSGNTVSAYLDEYGQIFSGGKGGAIYNSGTVTISHSTISGNSAHYYDDNGPTYGFGGGIYNDYYGTVTISQSTISSNGADISGGGIYNNYGTVTISHSTLSGNGANGDGGGIYNDSGTVTISQSTISSNGAGEYGGGIYNNGTVTVENSSSITGNHVGYFYYGADIYNLGTLYLDGTSMIGFLYGSSAIGLNPALSINSWSSTAHQLVLSWSTNYTGFTLQSSTDPGSTNWTDGASPTVSGASFVVTNSMSAGAQFFRLKR